MWDRRFAVLSSLAFCAIAAIVAFIQVTEETGLLTIATPIATLILSSFAVFVAIVLAALSLRGWSTSWEVLALIGVGVAAVAPSYLAVIAPSEVLSLWAFFVAVLFWVIVAIACVWSPNHDNWTQALLWLGVASSVAAVLTAIGRYGPIRFAVEPLQRVRALNIILDIRMSLGVLFAVLCVGTAVVRAFTRERLVLPKIPTVRVPHIPDKHPRLAALLNPPVITINAGIFMLTSLLNIAIGVPMALAIAVLLIGTELGHLMWTLVFKSDAALRFARVLLAISAVFGIAIASQLFASDTREYLRSAPIPGTMLSLFTLAAIVLTGSVIVVLALDGRHTDMQRVLFGTSLLSVLLIMAGGVMYIVALFKAVEIAGFSTIGPISLAAIVLAAIGVLGAILISLTERRETTAGS